MTIKALTAMINALSLRQASVVRPFCKSSFAACKMTFKLVASMLLSGGTNALTAAINSSIFWIGVLIETVKLQLAELPAASVTLHETVVTPNGNVEPEAGLQFTAPSPEQLSDAVGVV